MRVYRATKLGKDTGGDISQKEDDQMKVLRAVREAPSSPEEVSTAVGLPTGRVNSILRELVRKRMCEELTNNGGGEF